MREIKFRAFIKKTKEIIDVEQIDFGDESLRGDVLQNPNQETEVENKDFIWYDFNSVELMQFTGLKDKNGVEIYEGDIIKRKYESWNGKFVEEGYQELIVNFVYSSFKAERIKGRKGVGAMFLFDFFIADTEVIGNIYENPELLENES